MEGKKRYIAIILFLLICLMVFTFATTSDEELEGTGNNIQEITDKDTSEKDDKKEETKSEEKEESKKEENKGNSTNSNSTNKDSESSADDEENLDGTGEVDNSAYDKALEAVEELEKLLTDAQADIARDLVEEVTNSDQYKELVERIEDAEDAIDAEELVSKLEAMVKEAAEKADITDAKDFRDEEVTDAVNEIDGENLEAVKEDLLDRIEELSKILDDNNDPTIDGIKDGEYTNLDEISLTIADENEVTIKVTKDGNEIDFAEKFTEEGTYEVTVVDAAFNDVTKTFTIDRTQPKFEGLTSGQHYDIIKLDVKDASPVKITISKDHAKEVAIENGTEIKKDGTYRIVATDEAGNKKEIWVAIDSTLPTITPDVEYTNVKGQKVTIADKFLMTVTINGKEYTRSDFAKDKNNENFSMEYTLEEDGEYTIVAKDKKGLTVEKTIILDTVKPKFENLASREVDTDYYKVEVTDATPVKIYVSKNHKAFEEIQKGYELTEEATYQLKAVDAAGNEYTTWIHIDKTAPTITVTPDKEYMNVCPTIEVFDRYLSKVTIDGKVYDRKDFTKNSSNENFKLNVTLEDCEDGLHTITAVDKRGLPTTKEFTVDTTVPKITTINIRGGKSFGAGAKTTYYAKKGSIIYLNVFFKEELHKKPVFVLNGTKTIQANGPKYDPKSDTYNYYASWTLTDELQDGLIQVEVKDFSDKAGNTTTYKLEDHKLESQSRVIVDNSIPKITTINIRGGKTVGTGAKTTYYAKKGTIIYLNVYFKEELETTPTFVLNGTKTIPASSKPKHDPKTDTYNYYASWELTDELEEGLIQVEVKDFSDKAGNTTTYKLEDHKLESQSRVIVDYTNPEITPSYTEKTIEINSEEEFTEYPTFELSDNYKNDIKAELVSGKVDITKVGTYTLVYRATDNAGNFSEVSVTVNVVDTTAPEVEASYKETTTEQDEEFTNYPTFEVKDNSNQAVTQELISGSVDTTTLGVYTLTYRFTDIVGNYTDVSVKVKVVDTKAPTIEGLVDGAYYNTKDTHAIPVAYDKNGALLFVKTTILDEEITSPWISGKEITQVGTYKVYAVDKFGNKSEEITINIDPYAPKVLVLDRFENISGAYLPIKPVILEHNLDTIEVELDGKKIDYKTGDQLTKDGKYKMTVTDKAGNSTTVEFTMDSVAPTMLISPTSLGVVDSLDLNDIDNVTGIILSEEAEFQLMKAEKNITILDKDIPIYKYTKLPENGIIDEEGEYILIAYDKAYNLTAYKFIVDRSAPTVNVEEGKYYSSVTINVEDANMASGTLEGLEDLIPGIGGIISSISKLDPSITIQKGNNWLNKKTIENGYVVDEDGTYTLVAKDVVGVNPLFSKEEQAAHTTTVTFHIDTKKPTANVVEGGAYKSVTVSVDDAHLDEKSITINGKKYDGKEISEEGNYVLKAKDLAGNELVVNFEVDKTPITISGIDKNLYKKDDVVTIEVEARDTDAVIKLNGNTITSGHKVSEQGKYLVVVTDKWGNTVQKSFTIDTTAPVIQNPFNGTEITIGKNPNGLDIVADVKDEFGEYPKTVQPEVTTIGSDSEPVKLSKLDTKNPGKYELRYKVKDTAGNTAQDLVVTVNVMDVEYTLSFKDGNQITYTYDGAKKSLSNFTVQLYSNIDGDYVILEDGDINVELVNGGEIKDVGTYTVKATVNDTNKYPNATSAELTVTIKAKEVVATFESNLDGLSSIDQYEFNAQTNPFKVTLTGVVDGESVSTTINYGTKTFAPGIYTAEALLEDNDFEHNYIITNQYHKYEITKASATVSLPTTILGEVKVTNSNGFDITSKATINRSDELVAWDTQDFNRTKDGECLEYGTFLGSQYCKKHEKIPYTETWRVDVTYQTIQVVSNEYMIIPDKQEEMMGESLLEAVKYALSIAKITILDDVTKQLEDSVPTTGTTRAYISKLPTYYEVKVNE